MKRLMLAILMGVTLTYTGNADAQRNDVPAGQPRIYGATYGEWAAEWFQWAFAGPVGANAVEDMTGDFCAVNQPPGKVWFLAGTFNKTGVERTCTIPTNRALFYPLINISWIDCPGTSDENTTDAVVRDFLASVEDLACELTSTLDGASISTLQILSVRTQSPKFTSVLPENNVNPGNCDPPLPAGQTGRQIAEGYWVMLPPLSPGDHTLTLHGALCGGPEFETGVTYHLTVLGGGSD